MASFSDIPIGMLRWKFSSRHSINESQSSRASFSSIYQRDNNRSLWINYLRFNLSSSMVDYFDFTTCWNCFRSIATSEIIRTIRTTKDVLLFIDFDIDRLDITKSIEIVFELRNAGR